ncbi:MAG: hypothetical protein ACLSUM_00910 [Dysosmobacter welbionis]
MKDLLIVEDDPTLGEGIRLASRRRAPPPALPVPGGCRELLSAGASTC